MSNVHNEIAIVTSSRGSSDRNCMLYMLYMVLRACWELHVGSSIKQYCGFTLSFQAYGPFSVLRPGAPEILTSPTLSYRLLQWALPRFYSMPRPVLHDHQVSLYKTLSLVLNQTWIKPVGSFSTVLYVNPKQSGLEVHQTFASSRVISASYMSSPARQQPR